MNWGILGHSWAVALLKEQIAKKRIRHAYLLTGPHGVGRRTLALGLAQALNCPQPQAAGEPCQRCSTCRRIQEMTHPDLNLVAAEEEGGVLRVDQVRALQRSLALTPYESRYRVALLLRFEEANPAAANALLKTLEEPNPQVVILLTASSAEALLPTIASRCEHLRLRPMPAEELARALQERLGISAEQAALYAHISGGRPGYAIALHTQPELQAFRADCLDDLVRLLSASRRERFAFAEALQKEKNPARVRSRLAAWVTFWRDVLLVGAQSEAPLTNLDYRPQIETLAARIPPKKAVQLILQTERTLDWITRNVNLRLALEILTLDLPHLPEGF